MPELIDKQMALAEIDDTIAGSLDRPEDVYIDKGLMMARTVIEKLPTIEPEVKHAHWTNDTFCSNCNRFPIYQGAPMSSKELAKYFSYCPYCGAKMDEVSENEAD